ncbi:TetR/AcrR family transcriptional regulator [Aeromicrobium sp.]|uniref:TetR/AcrR family transcriptional regulator n=1 Tax=Aeromicrobium sp. TaxID=1871063 RepID=UPI002FCBBF9E
MSPSDTRAARQTALIDAAIGLITRDGVAGVKARAVVDEAEVTTMALYSAFGGLPGLLSAVCEEGYARLNGRLTELPTTDDPVADLFAQALEYRRFALDNPHLYDLLFGLPSGNGLRGEQVDGRDLPAGGTSYVNTFATLTRSCERAISAGRVTSPSSRELAAQLWALVHGHISLELSGHFGEFADPVETILVPLTVGFMVGQGDDREASSRATKSARGLAGRSAPRA